MAKALKCDICGVYFDEPTGKLGVENMFSFSSHNKNGCCVLDDYDACPECISAIRKLIVDRKYNSGVAHKEVIDNGVHDSSDK